MATKRSPILGYNHNFRHRGRVFHVQTEDSGVDNPHVFTHLFNGGVIIASRKLNYDSESAEEAVKALMQAQHKAMLRDLKNGSFDEKIVSYLGPHPDDAPDLPSGHVPATAVEAAEAAAPAAPLEDEDSAPEIMVIRDTEPSAAPQPEPASPPPLAARPAPPATPATPARRQPASEPPPVVVEFTKPAVSAPVEIHQAVPAEAGVVHSPAPESAPVPPGSSTYIQRGAVRREAPLINTGQMAAVMDPNEVRRQHGEGDAAERAPAPAGKRGRSTSRPRPSSTSPSGTVRPPSRPPVRASRATPTPTPTPASGRVTAPRAATQPREPGGSGVVVSRPSVIVGAPPKVVGGGPGRAAPTSARAARSSSTPPASKPVHSRARAARAEPPQDSLFGGDLISEKSLDEVILAYLSEDPADD